MGHMSRSEESDEAYVAWREDTAWRTSRRVATGYPYARADADEEQRQFELEVESWKVEDSMIWDEIRACGDCRRGPGEFDQPTWWHCAKHLEQLAEHAVYRPRR